MVRQYELIEQVRSYNPKADVGLLNRAYVYSMKAHGDQRRASGEAYLSHPLAVAEILAEMRLDEASIAAGLLHDTLEDTLASHEELVKLFGKEVADLAEGVTKLSKVSFEDKSVEQAENFRKLLLAMSQDIRVLLIKLADRLHNMRTIEAKREASQKKTAKETMEIYAPLADRIGLHAVKAELEDRAFKVVEPEEYATLEAKMAEWRAQDHLVGRVVGVLKDELKKAGIAAEVNGREKAIYSIYQKMLRKSLAFDQLTDIVAYRVLVGSKRDCYEVLGLMHDRFKAIPGRFKDYISAPKPNGYQSLHTSVVGPFGNRMEVQIRTQEMHDIAENGVAAHWLYKPAKGGAKDKDSDDKASPYRWLRGMMEQLQGVDDPTEFYENAKMELFSDNVFAFTPKGDLIQLPRGATVLDFAYAVHSNVGNKTVSAKINGSVVPLRRQVDNGDVVEVVTSANQNPNPGWREIVVSNRARSAINRYLRLQEREEQVRLGREILDKASRRDGWHWDVKQVSHVSAKLPVKDLKDADDVFAALGQGRLFPRQIFDVLYPGEKSLSLADDLTAKSVKGRKKSSDATPADEAVGLEGIIPGMAVHFAKCCSPLPGEEIVGIISTGRGVSVHMKTCKNLEQFAEQPDRWLPVKWNQDAVDGGTRTYVCRLRFHLANDPGALASVASTVANLDGNIIDIATEGRGPDSTTVRCEIEIRNKDHLNRLVTNLAALKNVLRVEKIYAWN